MRNKAWCDQIRCHDWHIVKDPHLAWHAAADAGAFGVVLPLAIPEARLLMKFTAAQLSPPVPADKPHGRRSSSLRHSTGGIMQAEAEASSQTQQRRSMPLELAAYAATLAQAAVAAASDEQHAVNGSTQPGEAPAVHRLAVAAWRVYTAAGKVRYHCPVHPKALMPTV
jgi:hypothetical protein